MNKSFELTDLSEEQKIEYLLSLREEGISVATLCEQYNVPQSTFYYWIKRLQTHGTKKSLPRTPQITRRKVTEEIKAKVLSKAKENPRLGCWRLSLFTYEGQRLSSVTIWQILTSAKPLALPSEPLYTITHCHQIWFTLHVHLRTLPNGQKVYSLIIVDGLSRVLLSHEICLSKGARDACHILLDAFTRWGLPDEIISDNAKAFISLLYTLFLGRLEVSVRHITPGCPWENPYAESLIGTLRDYLYPHLQRQKTVESVGRIYSEKVDYYNHREHWEFQNDEIKTPLGKLAGIKGRPMPEHFSLDLLATGKRYQRTVDTQGRISFDRYQLYVHTDLAKEQVEIREFFTTLVIVYKSGAVVSYRYSTEKSKAEIVEILNSPVFHDNSRIEESPQLELFSVADLKQPLRYVSRRPPNRKRRSFRCDATQLILRGIDLG